MTPTVLYVDDDALNREIMELILKDLMGIADVFLFADSKDFLIQLRAIPKPDIIFLDIHVEPLDGFAMLNLIHTEADYAGIPVVAISASLGGGQIEVLQEAGFFSSFAKPLDIGTFPQLFHQVLAGQAVWQTV